MEVHQEARVFELNECISETELNVIPSSRKPYIQSNPKPIDMQHPPLSLVFRSVNHLSNPALGQTLSRLRVIGVVLCQLGEDARNVILPLLDCALGRLSILRVVLSQCSQDGRNIVLRLSLTLGRSGLACALACCSSVIRVVGLKGGEDGVEVVLRRRCASTELDVHDGRGSFGVLRVVLAKSLEDGGNVILRVALGFGILAECSS